MPTTIRALRSARSLDALLGLLRDLPDDLPIDLERELAQLPVYGGPEPRSTSGVWSWDATRRIVEGDPDRNDGGGWGIESRPRCADEGCLRLADVAGSGAGAGDQLCPAHYQQARRTGRTKPILVPAAARLGVRVSALALAALGTRPAVRAREVIEAWAREQR